MQQENENPVVELSSAKFLIGCLVVSIALFASVKFIALPQWLIALEVALTILALFLFGSIRYRLDKNALTYGSALIIVSTFWGLWWEGSQLKIEFTQQGATALWPFVHHHFLTLHGLDQLVHADTMLFILGLTYFVSAIAQTRLLESVSFGILRKNNGRVFPTLAIIIALVSFLSGILDGVSMIGLMIRILVIILYLAKVEDDAVIFAVMVSTVITTVCGIWLAYGEPPNLIMKSNLHPHLDNIFFLKYCMPVAILSYFIVMWNVRKRLGKLTIPMRELDILDSHTQDVRFLQASRHGEVLIATEFALAHRAELGDRADAVVHRLHQGEPFGSALMRESIPDSVRKMLLGKYVSEDMAEVLDQHYSHVVLDNKEGVDIYGEKIRVIFKSISPDRVRAQRIGIVSFIPFIGLLIAHGVDHHLPLFFASFAGFFVAFFGVYSREKMRKLILHEAKVEYLEYLFLLPLFLAITLLQKTGFFAQLSVLLLVGIDKLGVAIISFIQFSGAVFLSALLDNNVVADFASRALHNIDIGLLHLFSMAQIAGYAAGGCWTHIGSAQSVVAYAFILKQINDRITPFQWIKFMTPIIFEIFLMMIGVIYIMTHFLHLG